jgi:hypothetical protein
VIVEFIHNHLGLFTTAGSWQLTRPMVNRGDNLSGWTADRGAFSTTPPDLDPTPVPRNRRVLTGRIIRDGAIVY